MCASRVGLGLGALMSCVGFVHALLSVGENNNNNKLSLGPFFAPTCIRKWLHVLKFTSVIYF